MPLVTQRRRLLVLACGRSGTLYTSKVFRAMGYDLRHESVGEFGCCSMYFVTPKTDCSIVNAGQKTLIHDGECRSNFRFDLVVHQIRDPLKTIDSLAKSFSRKVRLWTADQLGVPLPGRSAELQCRIEDKLNWAMGYWLENNRICEEQSAWTYRLEDFSTAWDRVLSELELPSAPVLNVSETTNRGLRFAFKSKDQSAEIRRTIYDTTWEKLDSINPRLSYIVRRYAERVGYSYE